MLAQMSTTKPCGLKCKQLIGIYLVSLPLHGTNCYSFQRARFWWHQHLRGGLFMGSKPIIPGCSISNGGDFRHTLFLGVQYTGIVVEGKHLHWYYSYCTYVVVQLYRDADGVCNIYTGAETKNDSFSHNSYTVHTLFHFSVVDVVTHVLAHSLNLANSNKIFALSMF